MATINKADLMTAAHKLAKGYFYGLNNADRKKYATYRAAFAAALAWQWADRKKAIALNTPVAPVAAQNVEVRYNFDLAEAEKLAAQLAPGAKEVVFTRFEPRGASYLAPAQRTGKVWITPNQKTATGWYVCGYPA
jgi:hypothetical protein